MRLYYWCPCVDRNHLVDAASSGRKPAACARYTRRERIFVEFIDLSSKAYVDALLETSIKDPAKVVSLYATMGKLRLFASGGIVEAAEKVMSRILETYYGPKFDLENRPAVDHTSDILR